MVKKLSEIMREKRERKRPPPDGPCAVLLIPANAPGPRTRDNPHAQVLGQFPDQDRAAEFIANIGLHERGQGHPKDVFFIKMIEPEPTKH